MHSVSEFVHETAGTARYSVSRGRLRSAVAMCICISLAGCGGLVELPGSGPAPRIFDLSVTDKTPLAVVDGGWRLFVDEPDAPRALDTDKVVLRMSGVELQYYKGARWSDRAPKLLQAMLVEALDASGAPELVSGDAAIARSRYVLKGNVRSFEAQYDNGGAPRVVVRLKLMLSDQLSGKLISVRSFESSTSAQADRLSDIVGAMNASANAVVAEATPWIIAAMSDVD